MGIQAGVSAAFKLACLHASVRSSDTCKIALYTAAASLSPGTVSYTPTGEVPPSGSYVAGGQVLRGLQVANVNGVATVRWTTDPVWTDTTITARAALIYNATQENLAIAVLDFGSDKTSTNGPFTVAFPTGPGQALIQWR